MASKRGERRHACKGKRKYIDQDMAVSAIKMLIRNKGDQGYLLPYRCKFCGKFHYGHAPAKVRRQ